VLFFALLPALLLVLLFVFLTIYMVVRAFGPSTADPSPTAIYLGLLLIASALVLALAVGMAAIGRSLTPRRRGRD